MNKPVQNAKTGLATWLEWCVIAGTCLIAAAAVNITFLSEKTGQGRTSVYAYLAGRIDALDRESDSIRRDAMCIPLSSFCRSIDAQIPTNSRVFLMDALGPTNAGKLGYYYFLNYYLYPREVGVSIGQPATNGLGFMEGRNPASMEELAAAGYDLVLKLTPDKGWQSQVLKPFPPGAFESKAAPMPGRDSVIAFLLPLAVALAGSRLVRWLFKDLRSVLTTGEWLASGLAVGMFLLTQLNFGLRIIGARLELYLGVAIMLWAVVELALLVRGWKPSRLEFNINHFWWLLLIPAGLMFWCLFRLAGLEGLQEFDAVAFWMLKAKIMYYFSGKEMWALANNPGFTWAHFNYPTTVPLLYSITYGVLGHVNEFVIKFWNQWMLLLLALAILGAGRFPNKRPWLTASAITIFILLPITLDFTRKEGGTIPLLFYVALASVQIAIGLAEKQEARLRLGLFVLMGAAMVKIEGAIVLGIWVFLLLLHKESRAALWPIKRVGLAGIIGLTAWTPYFFFQAHISTVDSNQAGLRLAMQNWENLVSVMGIAPMVWTALVSRRFFNNDFASWSASDNQHAIWNGKWSGVGSLADSATLGLGWVCVLALVLFWLRGQRLRWAALCFFSFFILYSIPILLEYLSCAVKIDQTAQLIVDYSGALAATDTITGGRYLSPLLMAWLIAMSVLLSRHKTETDLPTEKEKQKPASLQREK